MSFDVVGFDLTEGIIHFLKVFGGVLAAALFAAFLISILKNGVSGAGLFFKGLGRGCSDFLQTSPKRVWAITVLTWREASRKKALFVFVIFALLLMFAGWFLKGSVDRPDLQIKNYISFILRAITWLTLPVMLLLSCWGIPTDIKNRSLHTVVTKPVRRQEVMLGRFFGFTLVGSVVLSVMGITGYYWTVGQVPQEARAELVSRVPVYCNKTSFTNNQGGKEDTGINVGDIWQFRSYIAGGTKARALYKFDDLDLDAIRQDKRLRMEYNFEAFRTHKGEMDKRLLCQLTIVNNKSDLRVPLPIFEIQEFSNRAQEKTITLEESVSYNEEGTSTVKTANLFDDILEGNSITVEVQCLDPGQFIGMARPDLFIKMPDRSFASSYFKAVFGIWLQMVLIIVIGVTAGCFVKGPVATLLTFGIVMVGASGLSDLMRGLVTGTQNGGGPFESAYRMLFHMNPTTEIDAGPLSAVMTVLDTIMIGFLWTIQHLFPRFDFFNMSQYAANGIDVPWNATLLPSILVTLAFVIPCLILGYFSLQLREMEAK
ncbi:MAG: hypothetical protein JKY95_02675 [Planctomycetaceae bacterium]|nr:hypothetical protein [Planctomycetaceae bacterium]